MPCQEDKDSQENKIHTNKSRLNTFEQYLNRVHGVDIGPLKKERMTGKA